MFCLLVFKIVQRDSFENRLAEIDLVFFALFYMCLNIFGPKPPKPNSSIFHHVQVAGGRTSKSKKGFFLMDPIYAASKLRSSAYGADIDFAKN